MKVRHLESGEILEIEESEFDETIHTEDLEPAKPAAKPKATAKPAVDPQDDRAQDLAVQDAIDADKRHEARLRTLGEHYELDEVFIERHIRLGTSVEKFKQLGAAERAKRAPDPIDPKIGMGNDYESAEWRREQMAEALAARAINAAPPEPARQYAVHTFAEVAHECLGLIGRARGLHPRRDTNRVFELAFHTTSDFPLLLANALNKRLLPEYAAAAQTYRMIAVQRQFNDLRAHTFKRSGDFPTLAALNEHGEYTHGTMGENSESVTLVRYGRILAIDYEILVNDDIGAFGNIAAKAGRRVSDFENATFYSVCILAGSGLGPDLSDSTAVYDATHGNVGIAGALAVANLDDARAKMMAQTSIDGLKLNITPRYLLTSPASAGLAERLLAPQSQLTAVAASQLPDANNWAGRLTPIADANLTGTRFYVLADPMMLENYIYGFLGGSQGPRTETRSGFTTDGVEFKVALEFGCGAIEYRAGVTGAGA